MITAHTTVSANQKLIRVMSQQSGGDGRTGEYGLETGSRHIAFKRLLNVY